MNLEYATDVFIFWFLLRIARASMLKKGYADRTYLGGLSTKDPWIPNLFESVIA